MKLIHSILLVASQIILSSKPSIANVAYALPSERRFLLNVPEEYDHKKHYSLVLSFHGAGGFREKQQCITEPFLRIASQPFLTAYAQRFHSTDWKMTHIRKGAPYENKTVDDIAYIYHRISTISSTYNVDKSRYACGKSNGGGFTALLACRPDTSSIIAAFARVSPALYQGRYAFHNCTPSRPILIIHAHGVEDNVMPFYGRTPEEGSFGPEPDVRLWRRMGAERNGCNGQYDGEWA